MRLLGRSNPGQRQSLRVVVEDSPSCTDDVKEAWHLRQSELGRGELDQALVDVYSDSDAEAIAPCARRVDVYRTAMHGRPYAVELVEERLA